MRFIDEVNITVKAGRGGNGCMSFRREKYIPKGGPDGGDGGRGGSIFFQASKDVQTLLDFRYQPEYRAPNGQSGMGSGCYGRAGEDTTLKVPIGTQIKSESGEIEFDFTQDGQIALIARGGKGGLGNIHFKSSTNRSPLKSTEGEPGEEKILHLELKLMSDIGLVGFPNAGKSSLLAALTLAKPKIGDYPFTTLAPQLGVLEFEEGRITLADIPGILENAHIGTGLGIQFLKHISRSGALLFVLSLENGQYLEKQFQILLNELKEFDATLLDRPRLIVVNKSDKLEGGSDDIQTATWAADWEHFREKYKNSLLISAKYYGGLDQVKLDLKDLLLKPSMAMVS